MNLIKYEIFSKVVECKSLTKAGERLNLTQSAVSHAISSLERDVGLSLLIRNRSGVQLTNNGERLIVHIREILQMNEKLNQEIAAIKGIERGTVRIGTFSSVSIQWLPGILKQFQEQFPLIDIKLVDGSYVEIEESVLAGISDLGFVNLPTTNPILEVIPLHQDRMMCVLPKDHPLHHQSTIRINQIRDEPFIMPIAGCDNDIKRIFNQHNIVPSIKFELEDDQAILAMVQSGLGISMLPELILSSLPDEVCIRPLEGAHYRSIGIAVKSLRDCSPAAQKMIECICHWVVK
ncbi:LysR family transcriptional regulator [Paenibacillus guangzhouensis]|uniref:LysR family transcriptional regulator n=1 Tax=Paenibacillus guangzhouensis TaxID=1473112 RepID=UPI001266947E|nr:LysR family transcriptional regulator [Paenibacillus guangzhouensis]